MEIFKGRSFTMDDIWNLLDRKRGNVNCGDEWGGNSGQSFIPTFGVDLDALRNRQTKPSKSAPLNSDGIQD